MSRPFRVPAAVVSVLALALLSHAATAQEAAGRIERTPLQSEPMLAEITAGMFLGFGTSLGMAWVGAAVIGPRDGEYPGFTGALVGLAAGIALGSSLGVHLVARGYGFPARYGEAAAGALAGVLMLPAVPIDVEQPAFILAVYFLPALTSALASSIGSATRVRPVARAVRGRHDLGLAVSL